jgi:hypothetical protein
MQWLALPPLIRQVSDSVVGPQARYYKWAFSQFFSVNPKKCWVLPETGHDLFLSCPSHSSYVIILSSGTVTYATEKESWNKQYMHNLLSIEPWSCNDSHAYCYCYGVVSHKASQALRPLSHVLCVPHLSSNHSSWFIHHSSDQQRHLVARTK